jgi:SAM-dependent methyltransferase
MDKHGPDFYDVQGVFEIYSSHRARPDSPNETIEQPLLWELIGNPAGLDVLDLGCGDDRVSKKFRALGAKSYVGIEGSKRMFNLARQSVEDGYSEVILSWLEEYVPPDNAFDLVVSSLAFHYVADLGTLMAKINRSLRSGGRFVFSVEHPVITSCNKALENTSVRQSWIVDDYFQRGRRQVRWMGDIVTKYHRTIEDHLNELAEAGFHFQCLRESDPPRHCFEDQELWARRSRIPLFLILAAAKK